MPPADDTPESEPLSRTALLEQVKRRLADRQADLARRAKPMFRVVEVARDAQGRLTSIGQIWHTDLAHARRFGHALGANSTAQRVQIADSRGTVLEQVPVCAEATEAVGWAGWRERALPPLPAPPSRQALTRPPPPPADLPLPLASQPPAAADAGAGAGAGAATSGAQPSRDFARVEQLAFDPEATAPLLP